MPRPQRSVATLWVLIGLGAAIAVGASAQVPAQQVPTFHASTNYVYTHVVARDGSGRLVPGLTARDFDLFEDGVRQTISTFVAMVAGRAIADSGSPAVVREGLVVPPQARPQPEGRIFIIFIDDLHIRFDDTQRLKKALQQVRDTLLHDNDLIGIVSSGYASIAMDLAPDPGHARLNAAIDKVSGGAKSVREIVNGAQGSEGPVGVHHDAFVAFQLAYELLENAEKVTNRRKAFIYVTSGYDFNPYLDARYQALQDLIGAPGAPGDPGGQGRPTDPVTGAAAINRNPFEMNGLQFSAADLMASIGALVSRARRAGVEFWPLDPRGLAAGPDIGDDLSATDYANHEAMRLTSMDIIAKATGGVCLCRMNDFKAGLQQLDNAMSDYYVIGYESTNLDPVRKHRRIEIKARRSDVKSLVYRDWYNIR